MLTRRLSYIILCCKSRLQCVRLVTKNHFSSRNAESRLDTLQNRFLNFFRSHDLYKDKMVTPSVPQFDATFYNLIGCADYQKMSNIIQQYRLPDFIYQANLLKNSGTMYGIDYALRCAAFHCVQQLKTMNKTDAFKCFDALLYTHEGDVSKLKYSWVFINEAEGWVANKFCNFQELLIVMYYASMLKQSRSAQILVQKCLNQIVESPCDSLSLDEMCIIASSTYKMSVKILSVKLLDHIYQTIGSNLPTIVSDTGYFVTLIKTLRLAKYYNFEVMDKIMEHFKKSPEELDQTNFIAKVHILALYADTLYIDEVFFEMIKNRCLQDLILLDLSSFNRRDYLIIRMKDISRFLWAVSYLGYTLSKESLKTISQVLEKRVNEKEHYGRLADIVSILLSLWMLEHMETSLFESVITKIFMRKLKEMDRHRIKSRLSLLLQCITIEKPELLQVHHAYWNVVNLMSQASMERSLKERRTLSQLYNSVQCLSSLLDLHVTCECCIRNLNILGITVTTHEGDTLSIEVLDASVCRRGSFKPHGLMKLKLRLLKSMKRKTLLVTDDQFENNDDPAEMYIFLEEKLKETFYPDLIAGNSFGKK